MADKTLKKAMQELVPKLKPEYALNTAENHTNVEAHKRKKNMNIMEEAMRELMVKVKPGDALNTTENHKELNVDVGTAKKKTKKNRRHAIPECINKDQTPLAENMQDDLVIRKPEVGEQALENHDEVTVEQKVANRKNKKQERSSLEITRVNTGQKNVNGRNKKQELNSHETSESSHSQVKMISGYAQLMSENHGKLSSSKKKTKRNNKTIICRHNVMLDSDLELLPVERELKAANGTAHNLLRREGKLSVLKDETPSCEFGESSRVLPATVNECHLVDEESKDLSATNSGKEELKLRKYMKDVVQGGFAEEYSTRHKFTSSKRSLVSVIRRKLLILDLNGLLVDVVPSVPPGYKADKRIGQKAVFKRPFCDDFLMFCFERFDVGVWSSRIKKNLDDMVNFLMGDMKSRLLFCWSQSDCTMTGFKTIENRNKPLVLKELKKLWDKHDPNLPWENGHYDESNTLLLDDSPYKALRNPPYSAIFPYSYGFQDANDKCLGPGGDIRLYLEGLCLAEDVQKYVSQHPFGQRAITERDPSWGFYRQVIGIQRSNFTHIRF